jgi:acetyl-CoA synthetase
MTAHGITQLADLVARSIGEPEWFWDAVVEDLAIPFTTPYEKVLDTSDGIPWARWFTGGHINLADACVDRWAATSPDAPAIIWEGEEGGVRTWTFLELQAHTDALAHELVAHGVRQGDAVGLFLPMLPETVAAVMAVAKIGAVFLPIFSGYGAEAVRVRLEDGDAKALVTSSAFPRRGRTVPMGDTASAAAAGLRCADHVIVVERTGRPLAPDAPPFPTASVESEHPLFIAYTSGTTGRPKGVVHVHGGWTVKIAEEAAFQTDAGPGDRLFWLTDIGWIMGPWAMTGALANGATLVLYDGAPDHPEPDRLWSFVARHEVTICGISPTLIRALMQHGEQSARRHDLTNLRVLASTGEPWNEDPWRWYFEVIGGGRCPVINISGGTEVGACFLAPHPVAPISPMSLGGPSLGMAVDVYDEHGQPLRGAVGELVCTKPWPGMTRGLYQDPERYLETYWSRWPDVWVHGDWASIEDGQWYLHGRSDDTIKIAGKRLGPAEVESVLVSHPAVVEAAAVGLPNELKGEELWGYAVLVPGVEPTDDLRAELVALVAEHLGASFRPAGIRFTRSLPKTRSSKVLRRAIRATAIGEDPGDLSSLEDQGSIDAVRAAS